MALATTRFSCATPGRDEATDALVSMVAVATSRSMRDRKSASTAPSGANSAKATSSSRSNSAGSSPDARLRWTSSSISASSWRPRSSTIGETVPDEL